MDLSEFEIFKKILMLKREPVAIKAIRHGPVEFDFARPRRLYYCSAVSLASKGRSFLLNSENIICAAARRSLGFEKGDVEQLTNEYLTYCTYYSREVSRKAIEESPVLNFKPKAISVFPAVTAVKQNLDFDAVIIIGEPHSIMRIVQGLNFFGESVFSGRLFAMHGACGELTARVLNLKAPALSLLCSGARHFGKFDREEMAISIPANLFIRAVAGTIKTADACEDDLTKRRILEANPDGALFNLLKSGTGYIYK